MIGHHERSTAGWNVPYVSHLGAIPPLDDGSHGSGDLSGERRIPFGDLVVVRGPLLCACHLLLIARCNAGLKHRRGRNANAKTTPRIRRGATLGPGPQPASHSNGGAVEGNSTTGANWPNRSIASAMAASTKEAKSSKETPFRIHCDLRATTPTRCGSVEPCTIATTSRSCAFHVSAKCISQGRSVAGKKHAGVTRIINTSPCVGQTSRWTWSRRGRVLAT